MVSLSDPNNVANEFNKYFIESILIINRSIEDSVQPQCFSSFRIERNCELKAVSIDEISNILNSITTYSGVDNINLRVMQDCFELIGIPLLNLINKSLESGICPLTWKNSVITPVPKVPILYISFYTNIN